MILIWWIQIEFIRWVVETTTPPPKEIAGYMAIWRDYAATMTIHDLFPRPRSKVQGVKGPGTRTRFWWVFWGMVFHQDAMFFVYLFSWSDYFFGRCFGRNWSGDPKSPEPKPCVPKNGSQQPKEDHSRIHETSKGTFPPWNLKKRPVRTKRFSWPCPKC